MLGKNPKLKIIQTTHTAELSDGFGRKVKNLIMQDEYKEVFPDVKLAEDSKASGRFNTNKGGEYFAVGVEGAVTGRGADLLIIDDPHSEQDVNSPTAFDKAYEWYTSGPRQRLQPGGSIAIVMTRWSQKDLTAQLVKKMADVKGDKWDVVKFPAILEDDDEEKRKPIWPQYWKLEELDKVKASLVPSKWNAQWNKILLMMARVLLNVNGGRCGINLIPHSVILKFKLTILPSPKKKRRTIQRLPRGLFLSLKTVILTQSSC